FKVPGSCVVHSDDLPMLRPGLGFEIAPRLSLRAIARPPGMCGLNRMISKKNGDSLRFVVLAANTPWVYALTEALAQEYPATWIAVYDWRTYHRDKVQLPPGQPPGALAREVWLYPPGHLGMFRPVFSRLMALRLKRTLARVAGNAPQNTWLIAPYPWLAP